MSARAALSPRSSPSLLVALFLPLLSFPAFAQLSNKRLSLSLIASSTPAGAFTASSCASSTSSPTAAPPTGSRGIATMSPVRKPSSYAVGKILFIGIRTLFDRVTRGYGDHSHLTRATRAEGRGVEGFIGNRTNWRPEDLRHSKGRWPGRRGRQEHGCGEGCAPPPAPVGRQPVPQLGR